MSYSGLFAALENISDKVATAPTARNRKIDTSAPRLERRQKMMVKV